jgi:hypothetical protein
MYDVKLVARHKSEGYTLGGYVRDIELPFVPTIGMQFKQGTSTWLWETSKGELAPKVDAVIYDLDNRMFVCLFTVDEELNSSFWRHVGMTSGELDYFQPRN